VSGPARAALGVYVHVPFCASICQYCTFTRGLRDPGLEPRYVEALATDIACQGDGSPVDTLYFGGGTPSVLPPDDVARLVDACRRAFDVASDAEVTLEANPEDVDASRARAWRDAGISRLSLGVQSFDDAELARLGRRHSADRARRAVAEARAAGLDNLSLDLMLWLPEQRLDPWLASVDALLALRPPHASLYLLEVYPNAPLRDTMARERWVQAADDVAADMYEAAMDRLAAAGYEHYEISSVAHPGRRSRHNLKYWQDGEWLAFGCGAHGTRAGRRWRNVSGTAEYIDRVGRRQSPVAEERRLSRREQLEEALFMGLRLADGVDLDELGARYGVDVRAEFVSALVPYVETGHVRYDGARLRLSRAGMLVANEILSVFV
jgi:oxygen-independent coproporphyrinogen-3 oxidase